MQATGTAQGMKRDVLVNQQVLHITLLLIVLALGTFLRLYDIGGESYWLDEGTMVRVAQSDSEELLRQTLRGRPPIYVLMAQGWTTAFGFSEVATRSLSAVAGIAALFAMYVLGRRLFNPTVGLLGMFVMAISEFQIFYAQDFRYYSLVVLLTILTYIAFIRALEKPGWGSFALYAVASALLFYTHTLTVFVLAAQGAYFVVQWFRHTEARRYWFVSQVMVAAMILPGLLIASDKLDGDSGAFTWIEPRPLWYPLVTMYRFVLPTEASYQLSFISLLAGIGFLAIGLLAYVLISGRQQWMQALRNFGSEAHSLLSQRDALIMIGLWLFIGLMLPLIVSNTIKPMYVHRYVIPSAPALFLLIAMAIYTLRSIVPMALSIAALLVAITPGMFAYYAQDVKEEWRDIAALIQARPAETSAVVFAPGEKGTVEYVFDLYYRGELPACDMSVELAPGAEVASALNGCFGSGNRVWLVMRGADDRIAKYRDYVHGAANLTILEQHRFELTEVYLVERS